MLYELAPLFGYPPGEWATPGDVRAAGHFIAQCEARDRLTRGAFPATGVRTRLGNGNGGMNAEIVGETAFVDAR